MAAPSDARANRWNQVVNAIVTAAAQQTPPLANAATTDVDAWLNAVWVDPSHENDRNDLRDLCVAWLIANAPQAGTLYSALRQFCG